MNPVDEIVERLNSCLLTDEEMDLGEEAWTEFADKFGDWEEELERQDDDH